MESRKLQGYFLARTCFVSHLLVIFPDCSVEPHAPRSEIRSYKSRSSFHLLYALIYLSIDTERNNPIVRSTGQITDLALLFLPRQENHHLPPFLGIFSFMMFSTAAWSRAQTTPKQPKHGTVKKNTQKTEAKSDCKSTNSSTETTLCLQMERGK